MAPIIPADDGRRQRDGGIEVRSRATEGLRHQDAAQYAQRPASGDHHPAGIGCIGPAKRYVGTYAGAQKHKDQRAHKLAQPNRVHFTFLLLSDKRQGIDACPYL